MTPSNTLKGVLTSTFLAATLGLSSCAMLPATKPVQDKEIKDPVTIHQAIIDFVRKRYVDPDKVKDEKILAGDDINKILKTLDPHSAYLDESQFELMQKKSVGKFSGIGISLTMENGILRIAEEPDDGTPAANAGIRLNDTISNVNGLPVTGMTLNEAVGHISGKEDTNVTLTIHTPATNSTRDITLTRSILNIPTVRTAALENNIAYIRITTFSKNNLSAEFNDAVQGLKTKMGGNPSAYILDLRGNLGGFVNPALDVADAFLDNKNTILTTHGRTKDDVATHTASPGDIAEGKPLIVLVDNGTASASEIVAGALQDNHRATILGVQTFGKGSVQMVYPISYIVPGQKGALKLTTSLYFTPAGRSIQGKGITPDILYVPIDKNEIRPFPKESELSNTITNPNLKPDETKTSATCTAAQPVPENDTTLKKPLINKVGKPDYALLCAVESLNNSHQITFVKPVSAPGVS